MKGQSNSKQNLPVPPSVRKKVFCYLIILGHRAVWSGYIFARTGVETRQPWSGLFSWVVWRHVCHSHSWPQSVSHLKIFFFSTGPQTDLNVTQREISKTDIVLQVNLQVLSLIQVLRDKKKCPSTDHCRQERITASSLMICDDVKVTVEASV